MKKLAPFLALVLAGCLHPVSLETLTPPEPPVWDKDCNPGVVWITELATTEVYSLADIPHDAVEVRDLCLGEIAKMGFLVFYKPQEERISTTLPYAVFLGKSWDEWTPERQANIACHELVHAKWEQAVGLHALKIYATSSGRLAAEANAYRQGLRVDAAIGVPPAEVERRARARAADLGKSYRLSGDAARCQEPFMLKVFGYAPDL